MKATNVIIIIGSQRDLFLVDYAQTMLKSVQCNIAVAGIEPLLQDEWEAIEPFVRSRMPESADYIYRGGFTKSLRDSYNFVMIGYETWIYLSEQPDSNLSLIPSTLILKQGSVIDLKA